MNAQTASNLAIGLYDKGYSRNEIEKYLKDKNFSDQQINHALHSTAQHHKKEQDLVGFVKKQRKKGHSHEAIHHHLTKNGVHHHKAQKAIDHVLTHENKGDSANFTIAVLALILSILFIFPFLPPIALIMAGYALAHSDSKRTSTVAKIAIGIAFVSIILILFLFVTRGDRTGLAIEALSREVPGHLSHDTLSISHEQTGKLFLYAHEKDAAVTIESVECSPSCAHLTFRYPKSASAQDPVPITIDATRGGENTLSIVWSQRDKQYLNSAQIIVS